MNRLGCLSPVSLAHHLREKSLALGCRSDLDPGFDCFFNCTMLSFSSPGWVTLAARSYLTDWDGPTEMKRLGASKSTTRFLFMTGTMHLRGWMGDMEWARR
jgi:hypothetical protein